LRKLFSLNNLLQIAKITELLLQFFITLQIFFLFIDIQKIIEIKFLTT